MKNLFFVRYGVCVWGFGFFEIRRDIILSTNRPKLPSGQLLSVCLNPCPTTMVMLYMEVRNAMVPVKRECHD